jgi:hypothetical protein
MPSKSQTQTLLEHMLAGKTITPMKAMMVYGVHRLAARIRDLRDAGHNIVTDLKEDESGRQYAEYRIQVRDRFGRKKSA